MGRQTLFDAPAASTATPIVRGGGRPLELTTRRLMESRFHQDFSRVRVHTSARALAVGPRQEALAVTRGTDILVAPDIPSLDGRLGLPILAHELAHVAQHQGPRGAPVAGRPSLEREADRAAGQVLAGRSVRIRQAAAADGAPLALGRGWKYLLFGLAGAAVGGLAGLGLSAAGIAGLGPALLGGVLAGGGLGLLAQLGLERKEQGRLRLLAQRRQIDLWIEGRHGNDLPAHVTPDQALRARWEVVSEREFRRIYEAFGPGHSLWFQVGGFVDRRTNPPTIYMRDRHNNAFVRLHEAIHLYAHPVMRGQSRTVLEGTTEFFARQIAAAQGIDVTSTYDREFRTIENLVAIVGEAPVRAAFFRGELATLMQAAQAAGLDWLNDVVRGGLANRVPPPRRPAPVP